MVHRIYVEKRPGLSPEAGNLLADLRDFLGIRSLAGVRVLNRYDVENIDPQVYERAKTVVFSEPQADVIWDETFPQPRNAHSLLAVEALPGQFDQRADSCAQCIQLMAGVERPRVRHAKVYLLEGRLSQEELDKIRGYLINPVESREASLDKPETLARDYAAPAMVETLTGFTALDEAGLAALLEKLGLAMDSGRPEIPPGLLPGRRGPGPHHHRGPGGGHLLVRPLPPHHLLHPPGGHLHRGPGHRGRLPAVPGRPGGGLRPGEGGEAAPDPDGHRHHRGQDPEKAGPAPGAGRERGDQRLLHPRGRPGGRRGPGLAPDVQERDPQPPHGDRALRRRGHLHRRVHPGPPLRPGLRPPGHAPHRLRGPPGAL